MVTQVERDYGVQGNGMRVSGTFADMPSCSPQRIHSSLLIEIFSINKPVNVVCYEHGASRYWHST